MAPFSVVRLCSRSYLAKGVGGQHDKGEDNRGIQGVVEQGGGAAGPLEEAVGGVGHCVYFCMCFDVIWGGFIG